MAMTAAAVIVLFTSGAAGAFTPPGNNSLPFAPGYQTPQMTLSGSNVDATAQNDDPVPFCSDTESATTVWWRFRAPTAGVLTIDTAGSDFDSELGFFIGRNLNELVETGTCDQDAIGDDAQVVDPRPGQ
jgi:hypothetical protein